MIIHGYVIVSADGMLADESGMMPDSLKFPGDQKFFENALDRADLIVHGRRSIEIQPRAPMRKRVIVTRSVTSLAADPANANATLWNPAGAPFDDACARAGVTHGTVAVIGGPDVFALFYARYDTFWLSEAPHVTLRGGMGALPGVPPQHPHDILAAQGFSPGELVMLDALDGVTVTPWRREQA